MIHRKDSFQSKDKLLLKKYHWVVDKPKAILCLVHGLGEHAGRYAHVAAFFNKQGYSLVSYDLRGHGLSEGKRGHTPRYDYLHDDIQRFIDETASHKEDQDTPMFLYGHSLGGLQVITYLLSLQVSPQTVQQGNKIKGAIVTSPALRPAFTAPAWKLVLAKASVKILPSLSVSNEINVTHISKDKSVIEAYMKDDLVHDRISAGLGLNILDKGEWALTQAADLKHPMFLMHGSGDSITACEASQLFAQSAGDICQFKKWEGLYHEMHNEPEKEQVLNEIAIWLKCQIEDSLQG